jgi:choline dehydrogenase-like flavoprotein
MNYEVVIIGGSYAGMSAGMQLARARRSVLVIDAGLRRNRYAAASHGFLTQDGKPPEAIAAEGRSQLLAYSTVQWLDAQAREAQKTDGGFVVSLEGAPSVTSSLPPGSSINCPIFPGWPSVGGAMCFIVPIAMDTNCSKGVSACWQALRYPCTMR